MQSISARCRNSLTALQNVEGVNYIYVERNSLVLVATTLSNVSPLLATEMLSHLADMIKVLHRPCSRDICPVHCRRCGAVRALAMRPCVKGCADVLMTSRTSVECSRRKA